MIQKNAFSGAGIGVDAADAEQIEVNRARQMILAVVLHRPQIDEQRRLRHAASSRESCSGVTSSDIV